MVSPSASGEEPLAQTQRRKMLLLPQQLRRRQQQRSPLAAAPRRRQRSAGPPTRRRRRRKKEERGEEERVEEQPSSLSSSSMPMTLRRRCRRCAPPMRAPHAPAARGYTSGCAVALRLRGESRRRRGKAHSMKRWQRRRRLNLSTTPLAVSSPGRPLLLCCRLPGRETAALEAAASQLDCDAEKKESSRGVGERA